LCLSWLIQLPSLCIYFNCFIVHTTVV
jgi:hypothetical protein